MNIISVITISLLTIVMNATASDTVTILPVIPRPLSVHLTKGNYVLSGKTTIRYSDQRLAFTAEYLRDYIRTNVQIDLQTKFSKQRSRNEIALVYSDGLDHSEQYSLHITDDGTSITGNLPGIFHGVQTFLQLLDTNSTAPLKLHCIDIDDWPRFPWRGMHLDVARHFFSVDFIKKYIDLLAFYKFNVFHWHLTDDQGWRIEIKKYPRLTQVGAYRNGSMIGLYSAQKFDSVRYGGYYTQEEIREVVKYARDRQVTIVPEIEMPGHSMAALASYPELSCTGGPFEVGKAWGVYQDVFCAKDETFEFLENVLSEVCALFPGEYIHIGGDEVPKDRWKICPRCQARIKTEGLKNENELESYFVTRIEKFLNAKGKRVIGWDEILEGGLAPNAAVMSWRGLEGGIAAAKMNHSVVMTPGDYCYFDSYQGNPAYETLAIGGYTPVEKVYSYDPVPPGLSPEQQRCILGAQGNVWTEYINTPAQVEYMALPRMLALAEVDWLPPEEKNYSDFQNRLLRHFALFDRSGIRYAKSIFDVTLHVEPTSDYDGILVGLHSSFDSTGIYYTINGDDPSKSSTHYVGPFRITTNTDLRWAYLNGDQVVGHVQEQKFVMTLSAGKRVTLKTPPHANYPGNGAFTLVDGMKGDTSRFRINWIGFWGPDLDATIDLGRSSHFSRISIDFFNGENDWIYLPKSVGIFISNDTIHWIAIKKIASEELRQMGQTISLDLGSQSARYVRVVATNAGTIPDGKPGAGHDSWLFVDEIMIE